jgi:hypothetical protein
LHIIFSFVQRRNAKVIKSAARSTAIVSSLFPSNIRDRMYKEQEDKENRLRTGDLKSYLLNGEDGDKTVSKDEDQYSSKPLADLFPETTVMVRSYDNRFMLHLPLFPIFRLSLSHRVPVVCRHCWFYFVEFGSRTDTGFYFTGNSLCCL